MADAVLTAILDRLATLEETVRQIQSPSVDSFDYDLPLCLKLTAAEARVLRTVLATRIASYERVYDDLFGERPTGERPSMHVHVCNLRRKLAPYGIRIETHRSVGFFMTSADKRKLRDLEEI